MVICSFKVMRKISLNFNIVGVQDARLVAATREIGLEVNADKTK